MLHGSARGPVQLPADPHQVLQTDGPVARVQLELQGLQDLARNGGEMLAPELVTARNRPELAVQLNFMGEPVQPPLGS